MAQNYHLLPLSAQVFASSRRVFTLHQELRKVLSTSRKRKNRRGSVKSRCRAHPTLAASSGPSRTTLRTELVKRARTAVHLTCNSLLDWGGAPRACGDARAATAAPLLVSEARLIGHAWPVTDGLLTSEEGWCLADHAGMGYLQARMVSCSPKGHRSSLPDIPNIVCSCLSSPPGWLP